MGGGYVGVDVFFVISGFLITSHMMGELANEGRVDIVKFYDRRVRRIFPALFVVLFATLVAGFLWMTPQQLDNLSRSSAATSIFYSNFFFMLNSGYFEKASLYKPLLHTWSLAVEEQFYIFWPLGLYLIHRFMRSKMGAATIVLAILSLALSVALLSEHATATFYMLPTRAWELLAGAILAIYGMPRTPLSSGRWAWAGMAGILVPVFAYTEATLFPGLAALPPVIGSVMVIAFGANGGIGRILSSAPFRWIGLISYSLYLWHWPVLTFARLLLGQNLSFAAAALCVLLSGVLAALSWRYVERPFRKRYDAPDRPKLVLAVAAFSMSIVCLGSIVLHGGVPQRLPREIVAIARVGEIPIPRDYPCFIDASEDLKKRADIHACLAGGTKPKIVIWGDSHLLPFASTLKRDLSGKYDVRVIGRTGCMPLAGFIARRRGQVDDGCTAMNADLLKELSRSNDVRQVILIGRWARAFFPPEHIEMQQLLDGSGRVFRPEGALHDSFVAIIETLKRAGKEVVIFGDVPELQVPGPECMAQIRMHDLPRSFCPFVPETLPGSRSQHFFNSLMRDLPAASYVEPLKILCPAGGCMQWLDGYPVHHDTDHLTTRAGAYILRRSGVTMRLLRAS